MKHNFPGEPHKGGAPCTRCGMSPDNVTGPCWPRALDPPLEVAELRQRLAVVEAERDGEAEAWQCRSCGSSRWVGWNNAPFGRRKAQCVPCGFVQPLPDAEQESVGGPTMTTIEAMMARPFYDLSWDELVTMHEGARALIAVAKAAAALTETGADELPWWAVYWEKGTLWPSVAACRFCDREAASPDDDAASIVHKADCRALALEAALGGNDAGNG